MEKNIEKLIEVIKNYDDCIEIIGLNIYVDNELITDLEYVGDLTWITDEYKDCPIAYYNEVGEMLPFCYIREEKVNEICDKVFANFN